MEQIFNAILILLVAYLGLMLSNAKKQHAESEAQKAIAITSYNNSQEYVCTLEKNLVEAVSKSKVREEELVAALAESERHLEGAYKEINHRNSTISELRKEKKPKTKKKA